MIERFELIDFQNAERRRVVFDPITTFIGPTDAGKSTILRGLWWVMSNRPAGDAFIRWGADNAIGRLWVGGHRIERLRGKAGNFYALGESAFRAMGAAVPDRIAEILNVGDDNYADQLDPVFWLQLSSGQLTGELNRIVNLDLIDRVTTDLGAKYRNAVATLGVVEERLSTAKKQVAGLVYVTDLDFDLASVERSSDIAQRAGSTARHARGLMDRVDGENTHAKKCRDRRDRIAPLIALGAAALADRRAANAARDAGVRAFKASVAANRKPPDIAPLAASKHAAEITAAAVYRASGFLSRITFADNAVAAARTKLDNLHKTLKDEFGDVCPTCKKPA